MARWQKITKDAYEKGAHFTQIGYYPSTKKYIVSYGNKNIPKSITRNKVNTRNMADIMALQYRKTH